MGFLSSKKRQSVPAGGGNPQVRRFFNRGDVAGFLASGTKLAQRDVKVTKPRVRTPAEISGGFGNRADMSVEQLDALVNTFRTRKEQVQKRQLQPGQRAQTLFTT